MTTPARTGATTPARIGATEAERPPFSPIILRLFGWYLRVVFVPFRFRALRVSRAGTDPSQLGGRPLIVYSNHPSWWDPALFVLLARQYLGTRPHYGPMDARSLEQYGLFRRFGVFPVEIETRRGAVQFMRAARAILACPDSVLWITAEGRFTDARVRPVRLRPGLAHLARQASPGAAIVPLALEYPFWNESKPEALVRFGAPMAPDRALDVDAWSARLEEALEVTMTALAEESIARAPERFRRLPTGLFGPREADAR